MDLRTFYGESDAQDQIMDFREQIFASVGNEDEDVNEEEEARFCQALSTGKEKYFETLLM